MRGGVVGPRRRSPEAVDAVGRGVEPGSCVATPVVSGAAGLSRPAGSQLGRLTLQRAEGRPRAVTTRVLYQDVVHCDTPSSLNALQGPADGVLILPITVYWGPDVTADLSTANGVEKAWATPAPKDVNCTSARAETKASTGSSTRTSSDSTGSTSRPRGTAPASPLDDLTFKASSEPSNTPKHHEASSSPRAGAPTTPLPTRATCSSESS